jgi:hypothetical protein
MHNVCRKKGGGVNNSKNGQSPLLHAITATPSHNNNACILHTNIVKRHYISTDIYNHKNGGHIYTYVHVGMTCLLKTNTSKLQIYFRG